jgi:YggT family protein
VGSLITAIQLLSFGLTVLVFLDIVLSFILPPYQPLRRTLDSIVEPFLAPIRRLLPTVGMLDFSPMVLIILIQVLERIVVQVLLAI